MSENSILTPVAVEIGWFPGDFLAISISRISSWPGNFPVSWHREFWFALFKNALP
jgi:hypothetical protein